MYRLPIAFKLFSIADWFRTGRRLRTAVDERMTSERRPLTSFEVLLKLFGKSAQIKSLGAFSFANQR